MGYNIWYVPSNSSHVGKNIVLMRRLREHGHDVRIICLDELHSSMHWAADQIDKLDFQYENIPAKYFMRECPRIFKVSRITKSLFKALQVRKLPGEIRNFLESRDRPDVLIFSADVGPVSRCFVQTARRLGIRSILVGDGIFFSENNPRYKPEGFFRQLLGKCVTRISNFLHQTGHMGTSGVELIFVFNKTGKDWFLKCGIPSDQIMVVGSPEYEALAKLVSDPNPLDLREVRERIGIPPDRPVVLFAHQPIIEGKDLERTILELVEGCRRAGAALLVKFHPRSLERPESWRRWAEKQGLKSDEAVFVLKECTPTEAILLCTAFVTAYSTMVFDAMTCRRPMVLIQYLNVPYVLDYTVQYGIAIDAHSEKDLADAVASIVGDEKLQERLSANFPLAIQEELNGLDGTSVDTMVEKIEQLVASRRKNTKPHQW